MTTTTERTGLWLVGAGGSVAATVAAGLAALRAGVATRTGLVTAQADLDVAGLVDTADLVTGGHDVTSVSLAKRAEALAAAGVIPHDLPALVAHDLDEASTRVRPGYTVGAEAQRDAVERLAGDLREFREREGLSRVVVVNVSSTEGPVADHPAHADREALERAWDAGESPLPPSSVYAAAAFAAGCAFVDFTPSAGARLPVLEAMAPRPGCRGAAATARPARRCSSRCSPRCSPCGPSTCAPGPARTCSAGATERPWRPPTPAGARSTARPPASRCCSATRSRGPCTSTTSPTSATGRPRGTT